MIHVGEKVKIAMLGTVYDSYTSFLDYYRETSGSAMTERVCSQYESGRIPTVEEAHTKVFTVMFVRAHGDMPGRNLAIINDGEATYIISVEGLTLVSSDLPFVEGDKVYISDAIKTYSAWRELIKHASTLMPDGEEVYHKWTIDRSPPSDGIRNNSPDSVFTVKWIGHHISRPEDDIVAIVSNSAHSYIIGVGGLSRAGEKSWDKYIIYVRNWAVVNKDDAQSVRDATGPKSYAQWLSDKS